jgi:hypothetical protein
MVFPIHTGFVFGLSSAPNTPIRLTEAEKPFYEKLCALDLDGILDCSTGEAACRALGQEIFDTFKKTNNNSHEGFLALQNICNALHFAKPDGQLRKQYVERAWEGIGDENVQWWS